MSEPSGGPNAEQLVDELRKARVDDLLVHTCSLIASLAFGKLAPDVRDLEQARLAIDALKALAPVLPETSRGDVQQVVANLQLAYADAVTPKLRSPLRSSQPTWRSSEGLRGGTASATCRPPWRRPRMPSSGSNCGSRIVLRSRGACSRTFPPASHAMSPTM